MIIMQYDIIYKKTLPVAITKITLVKGGIINERADGGNGWEFMKNE